MCLTLFLTIYSGALVLVEIALGELACGEEESVDNGTKVPGVADTNGTHIGATHFFLPCIMSIPWSQDTAFNSPFIVLPNLLGFGIDAWMKPELRKFTFGITSMTKLLSNLLAFTSQKWNVG